MMYLHVSIQPAEVSHLSSLQISHLEVHLAWVLEADVFRLLFLFTPMKTCFIKLLHLKRAVYIRRVLQSLYFFLFLIILKRSRKNRDGKHFLSFEQRRKLPGHKDTSSELQSHDDSDICYYAFFSSFFFLSYSVIKHEEIVWCMFFQWLFLLLFDTSRLLYS